MKRMQLDSNDVIIKRYLEDIRKTSSLTREEEAYLLEHKDNPLAKRRIIEANMRFVVKVAIQYRMCPLPIADLVNEGAMGLMRAIETFDNSRGMKFITYGVWWIKAFITKAINEQGNLVRLPANQHTKIRKGLKDQAMGLDIIDDTKVLMQLAQKGVSIDSPQKSESNFSYAESIPDSASIEPESVAVIKAIEGSIREIIKTLPAREYNVLIGIYGIGLSSALTLREIGDSLNVSHERVRQIRDQAIKRIALTDAADELRENLEALAKAKLIVKH